MNATDFRFRKGVANGTDEASAPFELSLLKLALAGSINERGGIDEDRRLMCLAFGGFKDSSSVPSESPSPSFLFRVVAGVVFRLYREVFGKLELQAQSFPSWNVLCCRSDIPSDGRHDTT